VTFPDPGRAGRLTATDAGVSRPCIAFTHAPLKRRSIRRHIAARTTLVAEKHMLKWAIIFAIVSLISGWLGFGGVAGASAGIAKVLFALFVILFLIAVLAVVGVFHLAF
jgi:uncharacterized membrane protein YtjA (UPF0391 family)